MWMYMRSSNAKAAHSDSKFALHSRDKFVIQPVSKIFVKLVVIDAS